MKRFTKIMLIAAAICFVLGTGISLAAIAMGGNPKAIGRQIREQSHYSERIIVEEVETALLEISVQAGRVRLIQEKDLQSVEVREMSRHMDLKKEVGEDSLKLEFSKKPGIRHLFGHNDISAVVAIPENHDFKSISLEVDAGAVQADDLLIHTLELDMDAGAALLRGILADSVLVDCSAGAVQFEGEIQKLLDVEIDAGAVEMKLAGAMEDYNYDVNVNAGGVKIDGREIGGMSREQKLQNEGAEKDIRLECNAGGIELKFEE